MSTDRDPTLACRIDGYTDLPPGKLANVVTFLEMRAPPPPRPAPPRDDIAIVETDTRLEPYRALFRRVGAPWLWLGRLVLSDAALEAALRDPRLVSRTVMRGGEPIGLVELFFEGGEAEIVYFGLVPAETGRGLGRRLMEATVAQAFARGVTRLMVHTCTLDHPGAVAFYTACGFVPYKRAIEIHDDPRLIGLLPRDAGSPAWPVIDPEQNPAQNSEPADVRRP